MKSVIRSRWSTIWIRRVAVVVLGLAFCIPVRVGAGRDRRARVVKYSKEDIVPIRAKVRFSTLIVLPEDEEILDFTTGDKEFWIINGAHNLCYVHPAQAGIRSNLNLITASGHVYSFLLTEISSEPERRARPQNLRRAQGRFGRRGERGPCAAMSVPGEAEAYKKELDALRAQTADRSPCRRRPKSAEEVNRFRSELRDQTPVRLHARREGRARTILVSAIYHDDSFTYIRSRRARKTRFLRNQGRQAQPDFLPGRERRLHRPEDHRRRLPRRRQEENAVRAAHCRELRGRPMIETLKYRKKRRKPQGLLPKNVQSWLLAGLAFLMVAIMWLTGGKKPPAPAKTASTAAPGAAATRSQRNQDHRDCRTGSRNCSASSLSRKARSRNRPTCSAPRARPSQSSSQPNGVTAPPEQQPGRSHSGRAEDTRLRFAFCLECGAELPHAAPGSPASGSPRPRPAAESPASDTDMPQIAQLLKDMQPNLTLRLPDCIGSPARNDSAETRRERKEEGKNPAAVPPALQSRRQEKPTCSLKEPFSKPFSSTGSKGSSPVPSSACFQPTCIQTTASICLIPAGSKLLGETKKVDTFGQTRLAVVFHRILMPDGYSVSLDQFKGLDQTGDTGLRDQVNNHYLRIFGVSLAIGALGAVAEARNRRLAHRIERRPDAPGIRRKAPRNPRRRSSTSS